MMPPFELPSQFSEEPLEEPSFAQVAGAGTLGSGVGSLVDVPTSGSEVSSVVRAADSDAVVSSDAVVGSVVDEDAVVVSVVGDSGAGSTSVVVGVVVRGADSFGVSEVEGSMVSLDGAADVVSVVRGADTFGASEVEVSAEGSAVVGVVVGVFTSTAVEVEGSTEVVSVVRGADAFGASEDIDDDVDEEVVVDTSDVVDDDAAEEVTSVVVGVGSFASSSSKFSCASLTRKKVRSRSACASLISGG